MHCDQGRVLREQESKESSHGMAHDVLIVIARVITHVQRRIYIVITRPRANAWQRAAESNFPLWRWARIIGWDAGRNRLCSAGLALHNPVVRH